MCIYRLRLLKYIGVHIYIYMNGDLWAHIYIYIERERERGHRDLYICIYVYKVDTLYIVYRAHGAICGPSSL